MTEPLVVSHYVTHYGTMVKIACEENWILYSDNRRWTSAPAYVTCEECLKCIPTGEEPK